jgi:hypothetical protein
MKDYRAEDRAQRARLEKQASVGQRADIVGHLNRVSEDDVTIQRGAIPVLTKLRADAQGRRVRIASRNQRHDLLHKAGIFQEQPEQDKTNPGPDPAYGDRYVSPTRAAMAPGAEGGVSSDARTERDYYGGQGVKTAEPTFLTIEAMRHLARARALAHRHW